MWIYVAHLPAVKVISDNFHPLSLPPFLESKPMVLTLREKVGHRSSSRRREKGCVKVTHLDRGEAQRHSPTSRAKHCPLNHQMHFQHLKGKRALENRKGKVRRRYAICIIFLQGHVFWHCSDSIKYGHVLLPHGGKILSDMKYGHSNYMLCCSSLSEE